MNIKVICDKEKELVRFFYILKKKTASNVDYKKYNIKFISNRNDKANIDIYVIISNDLEYIYKKSFEILDKSKLIILTLNLKSANVVGCLNITPYLYYIRTDVENIIFKILKTYEESQ